VFLCKCTVFVWTVSTVQRVGVSVTKSGQHPVLTPDAQEGKKGRSMFATNCGILKNGEAIASNNSGGVSDVVEDTLGVNLTPREARMALEKELETYQKKLQDLQGEEGKFALIHGELMDIFETYEAAIVAGYQKYALEPFLVKQIQAVEQVQFVTRFLGLPCHT
jgi:hypothetical protein